MAADRMLSVIWPHRASRRRAARVVTPTLVTARLSVCDFSALVVTTSSTRQAVASAVSPASPRVPPELRLLDDIRWS